MNDDRPTASFDHRLGLASVVAVGVMVAGLCWFKLSSIDTGFHVAYGRQFLETGHIVTVDPFLDTSVALKPFINGNWGTQVVMALVEKAAGASGLIVLRWALLAVVFAAMAVVVRMFTAGWQWVAWCWLLAAMAAYERFALRPELFGHAVMAMMFVVLVRGPRRWRDIVILGILQAAWTNLTYYFLVGVILTGSMAAGELVSLITSRRPSDSRVERITRVRWLSAALVVQMAACAINPWHVRGALHPLQTIRELQNQKVVSLEGDQTGSAALAIIDEFRQPFRFIGSMPNYRTIDAYFVLLAVGFVGMAALFARRRWSEAFAITAFLMMSVQMRRNIAQFAYVAAPLAAGGLASAIPKSWLRGRSALFLRRGLATATIIAALGWTWSVADGRFYFVEHRINREPGMGYSARANPIDAARWLSSQNHVQSPVYTDFSASSNTLLGLDRHLKVLIDTNTFAFDDSWLRQVMEVSSGRFDYHVFFNSHHVNTVLLRVAPECQPLVHALKEDSDWALVHVEPYVVIFLRRTPEHRAVIERNHPGPQDIDTAGWINAAGGWRYHRALSIATMGGVPYTLGWYEPAARLFEEVVRLTPDSAATWNYLGLCHGKLAAEAHDRNDVNAVRLHLGEAIRCFENLVALQPDNESAKRNLGEAQESLRSVR